MATRLQGQLSGAADPHSLESGRLFVGGTLDETVRETLTRDLKSIGDKLVHVLKPRGHRDGSGTSHSVLKQWDLWGPLILCLFLSVILYIQASWSPVFASESSQLSPDAQHAQTRERQRIAFSLVYVFVSLGASVVTVNAKLLGSKMYA